MSGFLVSVFFPLLLVAPIFVGAAVLIVARKRDFRRKHPLTRSLRRPPGGTLAGQVIDLQFELFANLSILTMAFMLPSAVYLYQSHVLGQADTMLRIGFTILLMAAWVAWFVVRILGNWRELRDQRLGYECELAVGQELDQLMRSDWAVFHDIPGEGFNIDHIVVGAGGVFAIETKGRSKWLVDGESADYRVTYERGVLKFPRGEESAPIRQAERNAKWVSQWLGRATGFPVEVEPVVILPGWYVDSRSRNRTPVLAVGAIPGFFAKRAGGRLSEQQVTQIEYQIDQKTRDVEPGSAMRPA